MFRAQGLGHKDLGLSYSLNSLTVRGLEDGRDYIGFRVWGLVS